MGFVARPGTFKAYAMWDQIPMLMSRTTRSLFEQDFDDPVGTLTIPESIRTQVQPLPTTPNNQIRTDLIPGLFAENATAFETRSRRDLLRAGFQYLATPELTLSSEFRSTRRNGNLPYGASFGHGALVEFPAPIDHRLNDFDAGAEYADDRYLFRAGYQGSWFHNEFTSVTVDTPFRAFDVSGNSSRGRLSLPPSNSFFSVNGTASMKLPARSRATAYVSVGSLKDAGDPLMPQTVNTAISPAALDRDRVDGEARTSSVNLSFVSRPVRNADINVRYRMYDYDNRTPQLHLLQRVSYDNSAGTASYSALGGISPFPTPLEVDTEPFGVVRHNFDADLRYTVWPGMTAGVGYGRTGEDRSHRVIENTTDNVFRLTFDALGNRWFTLRSKYEHGAKSGEATEEEERFLYAIGEQPRLRHFDIAARDRNRVTVLGTVTPMDMVSFNASVAAGKDDYDESVFGLRDNTHRVYSIGMDVLPSDRYSAGASYSYERYDALSRSRQAVPPSSQPQPRPPNISFDDFLLQAAQPSSIWEIADQRRNWAADSTDRAHSLLLYATVNRIADKVDLEFNYDMNRARALYTYVAGAVPNRTLPEETVVDTTLPDPEQLPPVNSRLHRATVDGVYALTSRVGIGLSWWYERYSVNDFTLDAESTPNLARPNAVLIGYLYRPYTANTVWGRLIYRF
jgi:MtrB/PioB family decaheme-associated outer membrane protein